MSDSLAPSTCELQQRKLWVGGPEGWVVWIYVTLLSDLETEVDA